jgi:hypothetical protein
MLNKRQRVLIGVCGLLLCADAKDAVSGLSAQGLSAQGLSAQGLSAQGLSAQGLSAQGLSAQGLSAQGLSAQGLSAQGLSAQGLSAQGLSAQGLSSQGLSAQGLSAQGLSAQGLSAQGLSAQGLSAQGLSAQGLSAQGLSAQGLSAQGLSAQGLSAQGMQLRGIDRAQGIFGSIQLRRIVRVDVAPLPNLNAPQAQPIGYTQVSSPMSGVQLQASDTSSDPGTFIYVPSSGPGSAALDLTGSLWNLQMAAACSSNAECVAPQTCSEGGCVQTCTADSQCTAPGTCQQGLCTNGVGGVPLYIAAVTKDTHQNSSKYPSNDDVWLYTVYYRQPATGQWAALCPLDIYGENHAMALPLDTTADWSDATVRQKFTFACTASGVAAKCARNWGYKPWTSRKETIWDSVQQQFVKDTKIPLAPLYASCLIAARADYCQDGASYTQNGTLVDLFDTLDGLTSINATAGLPFAPNASGVMLHEEYQISALDLGSLGGTPKAHFVNENYCPGGDCSGLMSMPPLPEPQWSLVSSLRRSGMESSRYADRDPGRSCAAAPYIDRCDPKEPYACYRATNLSAQPYGAFLAVNSPRHCSHPESDDGEALDPLCNQCVNRVCQVDPSCCGDPGKGFYPGSLVWDQRCSDIREEVCRSEPKVGNITLDDSRRWSLGEAAPVAGSKPVIGLRGAIGALEGIACRNGTGDGCSGGTWWAEGWSCDPDYPGASNTVQISLNNQLGVGTHTLVADRELAPSWREIVSAECGGGERHGFELQVNPGDTVYAYGLDMDVPGAPIVLLRGGKKDVPSAAPATPAAPRAAIWTGWVEADESAVFTFCKQDPSTPGACASNTAPGAGSNADLFRLWVNSVLVNGNWRDSTFTQTSPTSPAQKLTRGVRYPVRVEYLRSASPPSSSQFVLLWSRPGVALTAVPSTALYPIVNSGANGFLARYYEGLLPLDPLPAAQATNRSNIDFVWTERNPPAVAKGASKIGNLDIHHDFGVVFEGEVVPPVTGQYAFSADTDGRVTISVNDVDVAATSNASIDDGTCSHDICNPGAAVSRTCAQGSFCAGQICLQSPYCCAISWDSDCVQKVADVCQIRCDLTPTANVFLQAGSKVRVKVRYQHLGDTDPTDPHQIVHGGHLHLLWSADGGPRDAIPFLRLFSGLDGSAPAKGTGLNAAYFSDASFQAEYLERVDGPVQFLPTPAKPGPTPVLGQSIICAGSTCGNPLPSAPALVAANPLSVSVTNDVSIALQGRGALEGYEVKIYEVTLDPNTGAVATKVEPPLDTFTVTNIGDSGSSFFGGRFARTFNVHGKGAHILSAQQTKNSVTSDWSFPLSFDAQNPLAPQPPTIDIPPGGLVSGNGNLDLTGRGAPGTDVVIKDGNGNALGLPAHVGTDGTWAAHVVLLGSGSQDLTATSQTSGGTPIASATSAKAIARVALPALTVDAPAEGFEIPYPNSRVLSVEGQGAVGNVPIGDGDGRYFAARGTATAEGNGHFSGGNVPLDYGVHKIKLVQAGGSLDSEGVVRTVVVRPPAPIVMSPAADAVVDAEFPVTVQGLRQGVLPGTAVFYQGTVKRGEARLENKTKNVDYSELTATVHLSGSGQQTLSVGQTASSLSGGGSAETADVQRATVTVVVRPQAPQIVEPGNVTRHDSTDVPVTVRGEPGTAVRFLVDGVLYPEDPAAPTIVGPDFLVSKVLALSPGSHKLAAYQYPIVGTVPRLDAHGSTSADVLVAVGDIDPPTVWITDASCPPREDPAGSGCLTGTRTDPSLPACTSLTVLSLPAGWGGAPGDAAIVDYADLVHAFDKRAPDMCVQVHVDCNPPSHSTFPLGSTVVTCAAVDCSTANDPGCDPQHPNSGSASFVVSVSPRAGTEPTLITSGLSGEAQGPNGGTVSYQVMGQGYLADCSLPGSGEVLPCTTWEPSNAGLGFAPTAVGLDPSTATPLKPSGMLYAGFQDTVEASLAARFFRSDDGGSSWVERTPIPGFDSTVDQLVVGGPASVYVPSGRTWPGGIYISRDGGGAWSQILADQKIRQIAVDPSNAQHMLAIGVTDTQSKLFETTDGWATSKPVSVDGLPSSEMYAIAIDPTDATRWFASVPTQQAATSIYLRQKGEWSRVNIPSFPAVITTFTHAIVIPPPPSANQKPSVFAGPVVSRDGGTTWALSQLNDLLAGLASRSNPSDLYFSGNGNLYRSATYGQPNAQIVGNRSSPVASSMVQDASAPLTLYAAHPALGLLKTTDGGLHWLPILALGTALPARAIRDIAFDPADSRVAFMVGDDYGVFRKDRPAGGHDVWNQVGGNDIDHAVFGGVTRRVLIDPFNRQTIRVSGPLAFYKTIDGGAHWASPDGTQFFQDLVAMDSVTSDVEYLFPNTVVGASGAVSLNRRKGSTVETFQLGGFANLGTGATLPDLRMQFASDARHTTLMSFGSGILSNVSLFSLTANLQAGNIVNAFNPAQLFVGLPVLSRSAGSDALYAGVSSSGGDPKLTRYPLVAGQLGTPETLGAPSSGSNFLNLLIDPSAAGQVIYTLGNGAGGYHDGLWESHDGGRTWTFDADSPQLLSHVWLSPIDGVIYGTAAVNGSPDNRAGPWRGVIWRRAPDELIRAGARVVTGALRPSCKLGATAPVALQDKPITPGSIFPLGDTPIECTVKDAFGRPFTSTFNVHVGDSTPPQFVGVAPQRRSVAAAAGTQAAVTYVVPQAVDLVDAAPIVSCVPASGSPFTVGAVTPITCTATDHAVPANSSQVTFPLIVDSTTPLAVPTLTVPNDITKEADVAGGATVTFNADPFKVSAKAADGVTDVPFACDGPANNVFPLGPTVVTCHAPDPPATGTTVTRSFTVTAVDTTPPVFPSTLSHEYSVPAEGPAGKAHVDYPVVTATDRGTSVPVTCTRDSGTAFPLGVTPVTCTAVDASKNRATFALNVVVTGLPPTLEVHDQEHKAQDMLGARIEFDPMPIAHDTAGNVIDCPNLNCVPASGTWFPMDETTVSCVATDGTLETRASFVVRVVDKTPPTLSAPTTITKEKGNGPTPLALTVTAIDNVDGTCEATNPRCGAPTCSIVGNGGPAADPATYDFPLGDTVVHCTATDAAGNAGTSDTTVVVRDTVAPVFHGVVDILNVPADTTDTALVPSYPLSADDIVSGALNISCTPRAGSRFLLGSTRVDCTARDGAGNETAAHFNVVVVPGWGRACASSDDCQGFACVDGMCCKTACGGGVGNDCQACSVAAGAAVDGVCGPVTVAAAHVCHGGTGTCDAAETCDGTHTFCPADAKAADGTACNDGNACTQGDSCQAGACTAGDPVTCTASDSCHVAGTCNPATGACTNPLAPNGTACSDGNACTQSDSCQAGTCTGSSPVTCTASDSCHVAGTCNPATGACTNPVAPNGTSCSDGNPCTRNDVCQSGACAGGAPVTCTASDSCHVAGTCNPATGACSNPAAPNGTACSDGNACTQNDSCQAGTCAAGTAKTCAPSDQCHVAGTCDPATGACSNPVAPNGTTCSDGNACTVSDTCQSGACTAGAPKTCAASDQCHVAGTCDSSTGACSNPAAPNGTACSDGNACTQTDTCQAGTCTGANPKTCGASDQCHVAGSCNPGTGVCSNPAAPNGTACTDGNACTRTDTCQAGSCTGGNPVVCAASDQCHVAGTCNSGTGVCSNPTAPNGTTCTDGNACTRTDTCQAGSCTGGNPVICGASDQCHVAGTCNSGTGVCSNPTAANGKTCNDGNACTTSDTCQAGVCAGSGSCSTVWTNVPASPVVAYATSTSGAKVTYTKPTAKNGSTVLNVSCTPSSGSTFIPGKTTVTCTATGATSQATFTVWVQYQAPTDGAFWLFPLKADGSSVFCIGKPVPARFKLTGASANITNLTATLKVTKISSTVPSAINSTSDETVDDTDFIFKYRSLLKWYAYRWKSSNQAQGTYRLEAVLGDGVTHEINVGLRK